MYLGTDNTYPGAHTFTAILLSTGSNCSHIQIRQEWSPGGGEDDGQPYTSCGAACSYNPDCVAYSYVGNLHGVSLGRPPTNTLASTRNPTTIVPPTRSTPNLTSSPSISTIPSHSLARSRTQIHRCHCTAKIITATLPTTAPAFFAVVQPWAAIQGHHLWG